MSRVLMVVSAAVTPTEDLAGPRKDYAVLADTLDAAVLDRSAVQSSPLARFVSRLVGTAPVQAWLAFQARGSYDVLFTDGEHIGLPLTLLLKLARDGTPHVTIGHRITAAKKRPFFRLLRVQEHLSCVVLHAWRQYQLAVDELKLRPEQLRLVPYQVDTDFWRPQNTPEEALIVSAGREFRDYPTLFQAVEGLDVQVVVGAASYWSKRRNSAAGAAVPDNVEIGAYDYRALRELYARAALVVVPLDDVDFQAGVTTILEAMAMGRAVVVTHSEGQTDVIEDRRTTTRGEPERVRPPSLARRLSAELHQPLEPTGFYVAPGDPAGLRRAIQFLLERPDVRAQLGAAARRTAERLFTVEQFALRLREVIEQAAGKPAAVAEHETPVMAAAKAW